MPVTPHLKPEKFGDPPLEKFQVPVVYRHLENPTVVTYAAPTRILFDSKTCNFSHKISMITIFLFMVGRSCVLRKVTTPASWVGPGGGRRHIVVPQKTLFVFITVSQ